MSPQPPHDATRAAGLNDTPITARTLRSEDVDGKAAGVGVHIPPVSAQGDTTAGSRTAIPSDVLAPTPLMGQEPIELYDDTVVVVDEIAADRTAGGMIGHSHPHRRQSMTSEYAPHEVHLQHALRTLGDNPE